MSEAMRAPAPQAPPPTYDVGRPFEWNFTHGPRFDGPMPRVAETPLKDFLGLPVRSRFGVAASILTNARWVGLYAGLGFDILTYKTVRAVPRLCLPWPNWHFVDGSGPAGLADPDAPVIRDGVPPQAGVVPTGVGSFGMPSSDPRFWRDDIGAAKATLSHGQILIVSVVATVVPGMTAAEMAKECARLTGEVRAAGADAVEVNLSCPNVVKTEGEVYRDPELSSLLAAAATAESGGAPLLVKVGHVADPVALRALLRALDGKARAVVMINALSRIIDDPDGTPTYGPERERAGVMGPGIKPLSLSMVRDAARIIREDGLSLELVGVGGIASPLDVDDFLAAGAAAAQCASAAVFDPLLAARLKAERPDL